MSETTIENAVIESTQLGELGRGFSAFVFLTMDGGGVGFGGFFLGGPYAHMFISRVLEVVGVERWEQLKGKPVRVESEGLGGVAIRLGHYIEDKWFNPREEFEAHQEANR